MKLSHCLFGFWLIKKLKTWKITYCSDPLGILSGNIAIFFYLYLTLDSLNKHIRIDSPPNPERMFMKKKDKIDISYIMICHFVP